MEDILKILACPVCKRSPLRYDRARTEKLLCPGCGREFGMIGSIPDMLPENIAPDLSAADDEWHRWSGKLQNFIEWRKTTWNGSATAEKLRSDVDEIKIKFVDFIGLRNSGRKILDIGCGSGLRSFLGSCTYIGIDPLLIEDYRYDFPVVRGVGEHLPFSDGMFEEAVLNQVLDHCNSTEKLLYETARVIGPNGSVNVMQYTSEACALPDKIYNSLVKAYLAIKRVRNLDTKTRRFGRKAIELFFRERFRDVKAVEYSPTQVFIRATGWKLN